MIKKIYELDPLQYPPIYFGNEDHCFYYRFSVVDRITGGNKDVLYRTLDTGLVGSPETVVQKIKQLESISINHVLLQFTPTLRELQKVKKVLNVFRKIDLNQAVIAFIGAILPKGHPVDLVYNFGIRHLFGAPKLPANPKPRRFACFVAALLLVGSTSSFQYDMQVLRFILGGFLSAVGVVVTFTNWCLASWMYGLIFSRQKAA